MSTPSGNDPNQYGQGQEQYGQNPYPQAQYGAGAPAQAPKNGMGITALVLGIIGLLLSFTFILSWLGALLGLVAIILGIVGMGRAKKQLATNRGVAIGGLVTGILAVLVGVGITLFTVFAFNAVGGGDLLACLQQAGTDQTAQEQCRVQFEQQATQSTGG